MEGGVSIKLNCLWWWQPLFYFCKPVVEIDGQPQNTSWGERFFPVQPGRHRIRIFFPYLVQKECGLATTEIEAPPGVTIQIVYKPPFTVMQPGKLEVKG